MLEHWLPTGGQLLMPDFNRFGNRGSGSGCGDGERGVINRDIADVSFCCSLGSVASDSAVVSSFSLILPQSGCTISPNTSSFDTFSLCFKAWTSSNGSSTDGRVGLTHLFCACNRKHIVHNNNLTKFNSYYMSDYQWCCQDLVQAGARH